MGRRLKAQRLRIFGVLAALAVPVIVYCQHVTKVESPLVVVDVSVTDAHRHPVQDLKESDFQVFENGKRQEIVGFQPHSFEPQAAAKAAIHLPKEIYSNIGIRSSSIPAINIILFDALNTPLEAQMFGRQEMIKFLKTLPPGQPTAVFELRDNLRMVAGFSTDSSELVAAAEKLIPFHSGLFVSEGEAEREAADSAKFGEMPRPKPVAPSPLGGGATASQAPTLGQIGAGSGIEKARSRGLDFRLLITSKAFETLANVVAGYPGRKNLLWLSAGFPVQFSPQGIVAQPNILMSSTAARLAAARLAVYPIDLLCLAALEDRASTPGAVAGGKGPDPIGKLLAARRDWQWTSQAAMENIAKDTGGEAFSNTNDLKTAFARVFEAGSNYYTLAYAPTDRKWNGAYRHIKVTVDRKNIHLAYRTGYYAANHRPSLKESEQAFLSAMRPGIPDATMLPFEAGAKLNNSKTRVFIVGYYIAGGHIAFEDYKGGRKLARIKFTALAFAPDGREGGVASHVVTLKLKPDQYATIMKQGILFRQPLQVRAGNDIVRIGVLDELTGSFGTIEAHLALPGH